ncbi:MAG: anti-sigma factor family protein [Anaerolineales bacterium]
MMNYQISPQDFELLSAYLDQELTPSETVRLEARLQTETDLKAALSDLRKTRMVLRSLPVMRAPRNFTLTPEMAGIKPRRENVFLIWFSRMRLSSALAAILLVLVLIGDFLSGATALPTASSIAADMAPAEQSMLEAAPGELAQEAPAEAAPVFVTPQVEVPPESESERIAPGFSVEKNGESVTVEVLPTSTPGPGAPQAQVLPRGQGGGGGGGGVGGGNEVQPASAPLLSQNQIRFLIRTVEISLAFAAVVTGLAAWLLYRRRV